MGAIRKDFQFNLNLVLIVLILTIFLIFYMENFNITSFYGNFYKSPSVIIIKIILLILCVLWIFLTKEIFFKRVVLFSLYPFLILVFILVSFLILMYLNLFGIFIGLEIQNILLFGFLSLNIPNTNTYKQVFHFFILSAFISGFFAMGLSLIYFALGTLDAIYIYHCLYFVQNDFFFLLGMFFVFISFLFKLGLIPFFLWVPALFRESPLMGLFLLVIISKIVYFFILVTTMNFLIYLFNFLFIFFAIWSVIIVTPLAIKETTLRGLFGYSSIIQTAFLVIGIQLNTTAAFGSVFFYLLIYSVTMFFIFFCILILERRKFSSKIYEIKDLKGFGSFQRLFAIVFSMAIFSIAGIPPFPGFFGKVVLIYNLVFSGDYICGFFILFYTIFLMFYYVKIVILLFSGSLIDIKEDKIGELIFTNYSICIFVSFVFFNTWFIFNFYKLWVFCLFLVSF